MYLLLTNAIQDAKLLSELKRLKGLRWYKVAKLMGEGATARNCHDRWRELVWPDSFNIATVGPVDKAQISDGWEDDEVSFQMHRVYLTWLMRTVYIRTFGVLCILLYYFYI